MAASCPGILYSIIWLLILWFLAWPFAYFLSFWYILFLPFTVCCAPVKGICESILKLINLVVTCAENIKGMKPLC